ncbi:hypothetical protein H2198_003344 [Neophaeococcomyces mojaviensis]|uniref:Uncharacterized protein n=1 Tax=Neophaeococcomyces mojaviensis TaxID=3383035 RepID=A0ACC3AC72_9EURO|nr:hypothetical protein H2198_003344 [Knufia sp. JES_112]
MRQYQQDDEKTATSHQEVVAVGSTEFNTTDQETISLSEFADDKQAFKFDFNVLANVFSLCIVLMTSQWANVATSSAIPFIAARFPAEAHLASWIASTTSVVVAVTQAFIGDLSDIFGRRVFTICGCVCGFVGLLIGGRAHSLLMVIGGQVIGAFGISMGYLTSPLLQEIVPKAHRPTVVAISSIVSSFGFIGAPIIEGVLIQKQVGGVLEGWRVGFYIGAALWAIGGLGIFFFYRPMDRPNPEGLSVKKRVFKLDWIGIFLVATGLTLLLVGLSYGGNPYPWTSGYVLGPMITGIVLVTVFVAWEWKGTSTGILPHALFQDRNFAIVMAVRVVGGFALIGSQAFLPQLLVYVFGTGGLMTAVWQLPFSICAILGSLSAALLLRYFKEARWITFGLMSTLTLGAGLMLLVKPGVNFAVWFFPTVIMGLSVGCEGVVLGVISGLVTPNELIATAICTCGAATFVGGSVAITIYGLVFNAKVKTYLPAFISDAAIANGLPATSITPLLVAFTSGSPAALASVPSITPEVLTAVTEAARMAYAKSFSYIWYILIAWSVFSAFVALFFTSTKKYFTDEVAAPVKERHQRAETEKSI